MNLQDHQYRLLFEQSPQPMWVYDPLTLTFLAVNEAALKEYGYNRTEFLEMTLKDLHAPEEIPRLLTGVADSAPGQSRSGAWQHRRKGGTPIEVQIAAVMIEGHDRPAVLETAQVLSDSQKGGKRIDESEKRFRALVENSPDFILILDREAKIRFINYTLPEYTVEQVTGTCVLDYLSKEDAGRYRKAMDDVFETGKPASIEVGAAGQTWWFSRLAPLSSDGRVEHVMVIATDITRIKETEDALEAQKILFERLLKQAADAIVVCDPQGRLMFVNEAARRLALLDPTDTAIEMAPQVWGTARNPDGSEIPMEEWSLTMALRGTPITGREVRMVRPDGSHYDILISAAPVRMPDGSLIGAIATFSDISALKRAQHAQIESQRLVNNLLSNLPGYAYRCKNDRDWTVEFISEGILEVTGHPAEDYLVNRSTTRGEKIHPDDADRVWEEVQQALDQNRHFETIYRIRAKSGEVKWVWERGRGIYGPDGAPQHIEGFVTDITAQVEDRQALQRSESRNRTLIQSLPDLIFIIGADGTYLDLKPAKGLELYMPPEKFMGKTLHEVLPPALASQSMGALEKAMRTGELQVFEYQLAIDGRNRDFEARLASCGEHEAIVVVRDITERKAQAAILEYHALHDSLTNLPNRLLLRERINEAIYVGKAKGTPLALMLMDLDRFKEINDTLGHHYGDLLLQQVGARLREVVWAPDVVARLGGDEFAVLLPSLAAPEHIRLVAQKLLYSLSRPFILEELTLDVGASIGIALFPDHGEDADTLLRRADVAMYIAKHTGAGFVLYSPDQDHHSPHRLSLITELRHAIDQGELRLHYQPKIDVKTGVMTGLEALVRWEHPRKGLIYPDMFIPLAERTGLIKPLASWVLMEALEQLRRWLDAGTRFTVAVNLSVRNLQDHLLPAMIAEMLRRYRIDPELVELEITESVIMTDPGRTMEILRQLGNIGVSLAIDDFGTGYSSLASLKKLSVDAIKVDKSFVMDMTFDEDDAVIVRSTVDLAHNLGLEVIAEGVENQETWDRLAELGCDAVQGYFITRPIPADAIEPWLKRSPWKTEPHSWGDSAANFS